MKQTIKPYVGLLMLDGTRHLLHILSRVILFLLNYRQDMVADAAHCRYMPC